MRVVPASEVARCLDWPSLVERLRTQFRRDVVVPMRHHHPILRAGAEQASLQVMPAWTDGGFIGIKVATVFPDNPTRNGIASVNGTYLLISGKNGLPVALLDGTELTMRRTAAASALASKYLSRPDSERLLMVGAGRLAPYLIQAHAAVRPICNVLIWNRDGDKAARLAKAMTRRDLKVEATDDLAGAVAGAHIVSTATMSTEPLIKGDWLPDGVHLDLVGGYTPLMREADDEALRQSRVFVDTRDGAEAEAGDIVQPLRAGVLSHEDIAGDLFDLTRGARDGRRFYDQRTLFKSVGSALEDLAAAVLVAERT